MALLDDSGTLLSVTEHWLEVFGCRREEAEGRSIGEFMTPSSRRKADEHVRPRFLKSGRVDDVRYRFVSRAGGTFDGELSARRAPDAQNRMLTVAVIFDVTATRRARQELQGVNEQLTTTLNSIGEGVLSTDVHDRVRYLNPAGQRLLGVSLEDAVGQPAAEIYRRLERAKPLGTDVPPGQHVRSHGTEGVTRNAAIVLANHRGGRLIVEETVTPMCDPAGRVTGAVLVFHDVTAQRQLQQRINFQARHDALTGLFNRYEFERRLREAIASAHASAAEHALLYIDLDRFKQVNDSAGHAAGDALLRQLSIRLQGELRRGDVVARLGGDEFGVLLEACTPPQALALSDRLRESVREFRFRCGNNAFSVGASIGLVPIARNSVTDVATALRHADDACYAAKRAGRNQVQVHRDAWPQAAEAADAWAAPDPERELCATLLHPMDATVEGIHLFVESRASTDTQGHLTHGSAATDRRQLDQLRQALQSPTIEFSGIHLLYLRLTASQLDDQMLLDVAHALLAEPKVRANQVCFEISEHAARADHEGTMRFIEALGDRGCRFALGQVVDAIGDPTPLRDLPVDFLHIEERLIQGLGSEPLYRCSVRAIAEMSRALGISSIASRVDDSSTIETLKALPIDFIRGDAITAAMPLLEALSGGQVAVLTSQAAGDHRQP